MSEIARMLRASLLQRSRELRNQPGAALYEFQPRQPKLVLHPMTDGMLRGVLAACDQFDDDIEAADSEAEAWELHQWARALEARFAGLVNAAGKRLNEFGAREVK